MAIDLYVRPLTRRAICLGVSALLAACGGGGDDSEPIGTDISVTQPEAGPAPLPPNVEPAPTPPTPELPAPAPTPPAPVPVPPEPQPIPPVPHPGPPTETEVITRDSVLKTQARVYAEALWKSAETLDPGRALPVNKSCMNAQGVASPVGWVFTGNLGQFIWNVTAARDLGLLDAAEAQRRVARHLDSLAVLQATARQNGAPGGLFHGTTDNRTAVPSGDVGSIENAWLAVSLAMAKQAYPELAAQAGAILGQMRFETMVHPQKQQYEISFNPKTQTYSGMTYGLLGETRLLAYVGIALGTVPRSQYFNIGRVPTWAERSQDPAKFRTYEGVRVYEGTRSYDGRHFMPTNGGSVFESFAVPVVISESKWGPNSWGRSHPNMAKTQIKYGLDTFGYWGFSPASVPANAGYTEYGTPPASLGGSGYNPRGQHVATRAGPVVSLYSVLLLIEEDPEAVMANMKKLLDNFPTLNHPQYGLMDSVDVENGTVSKCLLAGNVGWALGAVTNYLTDGKLRGYVDKEWGHMLQPLLEIEEFSIPAEPAQQG
jgi:hypothetical protein